MFPKQNLRCIAVVFYRLFVQIITFLWLFLGCTYEMHDMSDGKVSVSEPGPEILIRPIPTQPFQHSGHIFNKTWTAKYPNTETKSKAMCLCDFVVTRMGSCVQGLESPVPVTKIAEKYNCREVQPVNTGYVLPHKIGRNSKMMEY